MKLLLWNVNGIRAILKKNVKDDTTFEDFIKRYDIVILNETKINDGAMTKLALSTHAHAYHSHSQKRQGYSGVSVFSNTEPIKRISPPFEDDEGRLVILEYDQFILVGVYVPNAGTFDKKVDGPKRIEYRTTIWDKQFTKLCKSLEKKKPIIVAGDLNVANEDRDVYNASKLHHHAGFTDKERANFRLLLSSTTLVDVWRMQHRSDVQFSFFDYRSRARARNAGWRIDYFLASKSLLKHITKCKIMNEFYGSDHLPVKMIFN